MIEADSAFDQVRLTGFAADGTNVTVSNTVNITNGGADDIDSGDLIMLTKVSNSLLLQVTRVVGQQIYFEEGDSLGLNQTAAQYGTPLKFKALAPADPNTDVNGISTIATRIRLISYYMDVTTDPRRPRLIRRMNNGHPTTFDNALGTVVAFDVEGLQISYDLADGVYNWSNG